MLVLVARLVGVVDTMDVSSLQESIRIMLDFIESKATFCLC